MHERAPAWFARHDLLLTLIVGPLFIIPGLLTLPALGGVVALRFAAFRHVSDAFSRRIAWIMAVVAASLCIGLWASPIRAAGWPAFFRIAWGLALCGAISTGLRTRRARRSLVWGLALLTVLLTIATLLATGWYRSKVIALPFYGLLPVIPQLRTLPGGAFHPNVVAATLAPLIPLFAAASLESGLNRVWRALFWILVSALAFTLLITQSRGGWVALGAGLLVLLMLLFRQHRARLLLLAAAIAACITLAWLQSGQITSVTEIANSMASRLELWQRSLMMLGDVPFTGAGLASFPIVLDRFYPSFLAGPDARIPHAHNLLLQASLDLGLAGGLAVMALLLSALVAAWRAVEKAPRRSFEWCLAAGSAAALVVISVHGLIDAGLWAARSAPLFWALIGLGLAFGAPALVTQHVEVAC